MAGYADLRALVDGAYRDHLTDPAYWRVAGAAVAPGQATVGVILLEPDEIVGFGQARADVAALSVQVFKSDVVAPARGDVAQMVDSGRLLKIIGRPRLDSEGTLWNCEATEVQP